MTFEEILPYLKKKRKIRRECWSEDVFIQVKDEVLYDEDWVRTRIDADEIFADDWEIYEEPIDWDYVIKNKCLCWFWDNNKDDKIARPLSKILYTNKTKFIDNSAVSWYNCRPVSKDEITFYDDKEKVNREVDK